jgi:hypothetical protein
MNNYFKVIIDCILGSTVWLIDGLTTIDLCFKVLISVCIFVVVLIRMFNAIKFLRNGKSSSKSGK